MTAGSGRTVEVARFLFRGEAEVARALLESAGIRSHVRADDEGGLNPGFFAEYRVVLVVNADDAASARAVLGKEESPQETVRIFLPDQVQEAMVGHAKWAHPNEACGLVAGTQDSVTMFFCLSNRVGSPVRYTIDPREHYGAMRYAERAGYEIIGAWHSHPHGDAVLSDTDIATSPGGEWITIVVGRGQLSGPAIRAYRTDGPEVVELDIATLA